MDKPSQTPTILVIDDDTDLRYSIKRVLSTRGYTVLEAASGEEGLEVAQTHQPQLIFLDNRMGGMSGLEALQHLRGVTPKAMVILMTAYGTTQTTIEAMKFGAFDYVMKPFDPKRILSLAEGAFAAVKDLGRAEESKAAMAVSNEEVEQGIVGNSPAMQEVFKTIGQVAASDVTVMITGESGTGKELIARAIFQHSLRARKPFIAVNCAAIPENLIESELFGHEKGSFTGATNQRIGKFELCDEGTIFLDEIGDMALSTQTKILRALQEGEIQRVGGSDTIKVNVRLLAATNKPLEEMVKEKTFREDLYYRLNVVRLRLPALRERSGDIPQLVEFTLRRLSKDNKTGAKQISPEAVDLLSHYRWPGNVRELENTIYRAAVIAQGQTILVKDLPTDVVEAVRQGKPADTLPGQGERKDSPNTNEVAVRADEVASTAASEAFELPSTAPVGFDAAMDAAFAAARETHDKLLLEVFEKATIERTLREVGGNQAQASRLLGLTRATLKKRIDQYDIKEE